VQVHLLDGTYEIFRHYFGLPADQRPEEDPVRAARGVVLSVLSLLEEGVTHIGVATDHVIESFRNDLWPGYKSSAGVPRTLLDQFVPLEEALVALGVTVFPMVELEADDALAAAARVAAADPEVERVVIMTPDKDLAQCVVGERVVQLNRRTGSLAGEAGVRAKYGVPPASIPDYLALVGDSADGYPGIAGWGAKSAAAVLARYHHIEDIPHQPGQWDVPGLRGAATLAANLRDEYELALLFRRIATAETDVDVGAVDDWEWEGPTPEFAAWAERLGEPRLAIRAEELADLRR
jgi:5'-3' exonuclease